MSESPFGDDASIVYSYSRKQALADGVLFDLSIPVGEIGHVACTAAVYHRYLVPDKIMEAMGQSLEGRTHDLLWMMCCKIDEARLAHTLSERMTFKTIFLMPPGKLVTVNFVVTCGPGDTGEPVITIMLPNES